MATHHTCDRCGAGCLSARALYAEFELDDWKGDGSISPRQEPLAVAVKIEQPAADHDSPDLCLSCTREILERIIATIDERLRLVAAAAPQGPK